MEEIPKRHFMSREMRASVWFEECLTCELQEYLPLTKLFSQTEE